MKLSWQHWQKAQDALDVLQSEMQRLAPQVAEGIQVPRHVAKDIRRNVQRFEEQFKLLVHAQNSKAAR
jgi:hypothetical protein